jgi:hypothetical protein
METLLRLDDSFDVVLLDRVVTAFFQGHGPDVRMESWVDINDYSMLQLKR